LRNNQVQRALGIPYECINLPELERLEFFKDAIIMNAYKYELSLNDSEIIALEAALMMYQQHCSERLADGPKTPYWAHKKSIETIQAKLYANTSQISGNNF